VHYTRLGLLDRGVNFIQNMGVGKIWEDGPPNFIKLADLMENIAKCQNTP